MSALIIQNINERNKAFDSVQAFIIQFRNIRNQKCMNMLGELKVIKGT